MELLSQQMHLCWQGFLPGYWLSFELHEVVLPDMVRD